MIKKIVLFLILFSSWCLGAPHQELWTTPWFTGPLLAPSALVNEPKQITWQPYLFVTNNYGVYNNHWNPVNTPDTWVIQPLLDLTYGIAPSIDIECTPAFVYQLSEGASSVRMSDTPLFVGIQLLRQSKYPSLFDLRFRLQQLLPFGQYDKLNPSKKGTDGSGLGSYQSGITLDFQKTFKMAPEQYFRLRWALETFLYTSTVSIKGLSVYGGGPATRGTIRPGKTWTAYLSGEYTITRQWCLALDTVYNLMTSSRFSGNKGGEPVGVPTSQQISIAPAVEYNLSENFGFIGGMWFTLAGKNAAQFYSGVFSAVLNY